MMRRRLLRVVSAKVMDLFDHQLRSFTFVITERKGDFQAASQQQQRHYFANMRET